MEENKFFRLVWRTNALIIFFAGVACLLAVMAGTGMIVKELFFTNRPVQNIVNIDDTHSKSEELQLSYALLLNDSAYYRIDLKTAQEYFQSNFSKETLSTRNYLFVDTANGNRHWLLSDHNSVILNDRALDWRSKDNKHRSTFGYVYTITSEDTNNDKRLSGQDKQTLAVTDKNGKNYTVFAKGIDDLLSADVITPKRASLLYRKDTELYLLSISLPDLTVISEKHIDLDLVYENKSKEQDKE